MKKITLLLLIFNFLFSCCPPEDDVRGLISFEMEIFDANGNEIFGDSDGIYPLDSLTIIDQETNEEILFSNDGFTGRFHFSINVRQKEAGQHEFLYGFRYPFPNTDTLSITISKSELDKCGNFNRELAEIKFNGIEPERKDGRFILISGN